MRDERYVDWKEVYRESKRRKPWAGVAHEPDVNLDDPDFIRRTFGDEEVQPDDARRSIRQVEQRIKQGAASRGWTFLKAVMQARRRDRLRFTSAPKELASQRVDPDVLAELKAVQTWEEFTYWKERVLCSYPTRREGTEDRRAEEKVNISVLPYGGLVATVKKFTTPYGWSSAQYKEWYAAGRPAVPAFFTSEQRDNINVSWPGRRPLIPSWSSEDVAGMFRWMLADTAKHGHWVPGTKGWVWVPVSGTVRPIVHSPNRYGKSSTYDGWKQYATWIKHTTQREHAEALRRVFYYLRQLLAALQGVREPRQTSASVLLHEDTCPDHGDVEPCGKCAKMRAAGWRRVSQEFAQQSEACYEVNGKRGMPWRGEGPWSKHPAPVLPATDPRGLRVLRMLPWWKSGLIQVLDREITSEQQRLLDAFERRPNMAKGEKLATVSVKKMSADLWHKAKMAALAARQEMGEWLADAIREKLERS